MDKRIPIDKAKSVLLLTAALVMVVTWGVGSTGWTKGINIITFVGLGSILIGLMLARSILPAFVAHIFAIIIGIGWSFWVTSRLLPINYSWIDRWENLAQRLNIWYQRALEGGTSYDNLMFIFQMGIIVFAMGYLTVWFLFRSGKVWPAIVPGGLVLLINLYYAPNDISFWFITFMLVSLLLVIRFNLFDQEKKWRRNGVFFRPDISFDFLRDGFIFSALIIAFAWFTPPAVDAKTLGLLDEFQGSWRDVQGEWNRLFADLNYRNRQAYDSFGTSLRLGGPRTLTDEPVMNVKVDGIGRYWRAVVFDYYTGDGWLTRDEDKASFGPSAPLALPVFEAREAVTQTYTFYRDKATVLYAMSNPVALSRSARVTFNSLPTEQIVSQSSPAWPDIGEPWVEEITYIRSNATVDNGENYQVVSAASRATISELRNAGDQYPAWITERYLQLPESITERTRQLARDLTESANNDFDRTRAIERHLRSDIKYNERIQAPPPGVDKVDYILFNAKEAYCDYYASSMIVMLRSLGIPARLAAGYAQGKYDSDLDAFQVVNKDAHSWVEVFFPQYGWIEFEPTAAQPTIIRPTSDDDRFASPAIPPENRPGLEDFPLGDFDEDYLLEEDFLTGGAVPLNITFPIFGFNITVPRSAVSGSLWLIGLAIASVVIAGGLWWRQQNKIRPNENIFSLYQRMVKFAGWMGLTVQPWQTPYEHATMLQSSLPAHQRDVENITNEYVYQRYSKNGTTVKKQDTLFSYANRSDVAWNRLRPAMLKAAAKQRLPGWLRKRM